MPTPPEAPRTIAVVGGSSELAEAVVIQLLGRRQAEVALLGRSSERLAEVAGRLRRAGALGVETLPAEAEEPGSVAGALRQAAALLGRLDLVLVAIGALDPPGSDGTDPEAVRRGFVVNSVAPAEAGAEAARLLRAQGGGSLVLLSSMAAVRPRRAHVVYGPAKAGADAYFRSLGEVLEPDGVFVMVVRPGFVWGRMTAGRPPMPLSTDPATVGRAVVAALERRQRVVYVPSELALVARALDVVPEPLWRTIADEGLAARLEGVLARARSALGR